MRSAEVMSEGGEAKCLDIIAPAALIIGSATPNEQPHRVERPEQMNNKAFHKLSLIRNRQSGRRRNRDHQGSINILQIAGTFERSRCLKFSLEVI